MFAGGFALAAGAVGALDEAGRATTGVSVIDGAIAVVVFAVAGLLGGGPAGDAIAPGLLGGAGLYTGCAGALALELETLGVGCTSKGIGGVADPGFTRTAKASSVRLIDLSVAVIVEVVVALFFLGFEQGFALEFVAFAHESTAQTRAKESFDLAASTDIGTGIDLAADVQDADVRPVLGAIRGAVAEGDPFSGVGRIVRTTCGESK